MKCCNCAISPTKKPAMRRRIPKAGALYHVFEGLPHGAPLRKWQSAHRCQAAPLGQSMLLSRLALRRREWWENPVFTMDGIMNPQTL